LTEIKMTKLGLEAGIQPACATTTAPNRVGRASKTTNGEIAKRIRTSNVCASPINFAQLRVAEFFNRASWIRGQNRQHFFAQAIAELSIFPSTDNFILVHFCFPHFNQPQSQGLVGQIRPHLVNPMQV
jgi:hypothetical protein